MMKVTNSIVANDPQKTLDNKCARTSVQKFVLFSTLPVSHTSLKFGGQPYYESGASNGDYTLM